MSELRKGATTKWLTEFTCLPCLKIPACISIWQIINNYSKLNLGSGHLDGNDQYKNKDKNSTKTGNYYC